MDKQLLHAVQKFWTLESLGITTNKPEVMETFLHTIQHDERRYVVNLQARSTAVGGGAARGVGGGDLPRNFFEIRVQNPAFWALLALLYYGGRGRAKAGAAATPLIFHGGRCTGCYRTTISSVNADYSLP